MKIIFALSLCCIAFWSCDRSTNTNVPPSPSVQIDSCGHDQPVTTLDSSTGNWFRAKWQSLYLSFSPDRRFFATYVGDQHGRTRYGVSIYDVSLQKTALHIPAHSLPSWSPDGKYLVVFPASFDIPTIVNMETFSQSKLTNMNFFSSVVWDDRGDYIYFSREGYDREKPFPYNKWGLFRARTDGSELEFLTDSIVDPKVLDSETLISLFPRGEYRGFNIVRYNILTRKITKDSVYGYQGNTIDVRNVQLSPDRTKLAFDRLPYIKQTTEERSPYGGVWILDLKTLQSRQVLPEQFAWQNLYYPRWYSNTELLCSFHCRKDTAITTWLVDLNGKVLRQITNKNMKLIP